MAYIIGNTTVIDNNAALGAVSGNSLNLANNANISAGGGGVKSLSASSNFSDSDLGSTGAIAICLGGGGGSARSNQYQNSAGGPGGTVVHAFALTAATNITATIGGAGNNRSGSGNPNSRAPAGGASSITYPTVQSHNAGGGNGGMHNGNVVSPGNVGFGLGASPGFPNFGRGAPSPPVSAHSGYIGILGL